MEDNNLCILIVEDELIVARDLQMKLKKLGYYNTSIILPSENILVDLEKLCPDLLLIDVNLGMEIDGIDISKQVKIPSVFITANSNMDTKYRAISEYFVDFLSKPFEEDELKVMLEFAKIRIKLLEETKMDNIKFLEIINCQQGFSLITDYEGNITFCTGNCNFVLGYGIQDIIGKNIFDYVFKKDKIFLKKSFSNFTKNPNLKLSFEIKFLHNNGEYLWVSFYAQKSKFNNDIVITLKDISEQKLNEETLVNLSLYDHLTGLANRKLVLERLMHDSQIATRKNERIGILFIDLDKFKPVNDNFGHEVGDLLLIQIAERIKKSIRESDTAARIGGDEFLVLITGIYINMDISIAVSRILDELEKPFEINKHKINISASIGVTIFPDDGKDLEELIKLADAAMYAAKKNGGNKYIIYNSTEFSSNKNEIKILHKS